MVLANSLAPQREQVEGSSVQCKGNDGGHVGLFSNKGLGLDFPATHSNDAKCTNLESCSEVGVLREGSPRKDSMGVKNVVLMRTSSTYHLGI